MSYRYKFNNPDQLELFPEASKQPEKDKRPRYILKDLTLSIENIIVVSIIFVMTLVLFFAFGVERGRKVVQQRDLPEVVSEWSRQDASVREQAVTAKITVTTQEPVSESGEEKPRETLAPQPEKEENLLPIEENTLEEGYTIQVASFKLEKNARREAERIKDAGHDIFVLPKGDYFIVCVGKFLQREEARAFSHQLKKRYQDLLVRRF